jgi:hypothetical protein
MNHIKTMLCGNSIGIDKLERLKLLQSDPLVNEFAISIKEPERVSRLLGNFSSKTTQMLREINTYNLFLLLKMDFAGETKYRQQIKTFRLKYIFLAGKIISDARICESGSLNLMQAGGNDAIIRPRQSKSSPFEVKMLVKFI